MKTSDIKPVNEAIKLTAITKANEDSIALMRQSLIDKRRKFIMLQRQLKNLTAEKKAYKDLEKTLNKMQQEIDDLGEKVKVKKVKESISSYAEGFKTKLLKVIEETTYTNIDDWKKAVKTSHPTQAAKMRFNGRMEGGKMTVSAEVPGVDRCFGVWDPSEEGGADEGTGKVLHEAHKGHWSSQNKTKPKAKTPVSTKCIDDISPFQKGVRVKIKSGPKDAVGWEATIVKVGKSIDGGRTFVVDFDRDGEDHPDSVELKATNLRVVKK